MKSNYKELGDDMKNSYKIKILINVIMIFTIIINFNYIVEAKFEGEIQGSVVNDSDPSENPDYYHPTKISPQEPEVQEKIGNILGVINVIGIVSSVIILMIIGMKYMFGSVEEKAEYKKTMSMYLLGTLILFSASTLPNIIYKFATAFNTV